MALIIERVSGLAIRAAWGPPREFLHLLGRQPSDLAIVDAETYLGLAQGRASAVSGLRCPLFVYGGERIPSSELAPRVRVIPSSAPARELTAMLVDRIRRGRGEGRTPPAANGAEPGDCDEDALPGALPADLSRREEEVLRLLALGATNAEIAGALGIALPTVKVHVHRLIRKLKVRNRGQAVAAHRFTQQLKSEPPATSTEAGQRRVR